MWKSKLDWDEIVPEELHKIWLRFYNDLFSLNSLKVARNVLIDAKKECYLELHGFCDASEKAYGAVVYIRSIDKDGRVSSNLLCAKSRVAPIKPLTIPRLELCGAVLLSKLVSNVLKVINIRFDKVIYWSNSTIGLAWIKSNPGQFKPFVSNRIRKIQSLTEKERWLYVNTRENPAGIISRLYNHRQ